MQIHLFDGQRFERHVVVIQFVLCHNGQTSGVHSAVHLKQKMSNKL